MRDKLGLLLLIIAFFRIPYGNQTLQPGQTSRFANSILLTQAFALPASEGENKGYYVSPSGSDSNPGTSLRPWKTIGKAAQAVRPGDRVILRGGIYKEVVDFTTSGQLPSPSRSRLIQARRR